MTIKSRGLVRLHEKLKSLYLHYHNAYGYQFWQGGGDYKKEFCSIKLLYPLITLSCKGQVKYFSCCITTKLDKVVTYYKKINPLNHTILWIHGHVRSRDKLKTFLTTTAITMATKPGRVVK